MSGLIVRGLAFWIWIGLGCLPLGMFAFWVHNAGHKSVHGAVEAVRNVAWSEVSGPGIRF